MTCILKPELRTMTSRLELETLIGPADKLVPSSKNRHLLAQWGAMFGVNTMVSIINLYHNPPAVVPTAAQVAAAEELYRSIMGETVTPVATPIANNKLNHQATAEVLFVVKLGHPVMMVGPAGCGKTTIGEHIAQVLDLPFYITSTVFDTHELMGFVDGMGRYHTTPFRQAFEAGGVWVADEIDAWDAAALLAANSALAQGLVTFPDSPAPVQVHADFRMIATANTFGKGADRVYVGRNELDAASLDRYATIEIDYDPSLEMALCNANVQWLERVRSVREQVTERKIRHVVSTRAIIRGSQALAAGMKRPRVEAIYLFKGMSANDKDKIK